MNVIYDTGIDEATKDRLEEAAALKDIKVKESDEPKKGATNVYVGVHGEDGKAEDYITKEYAPGDALFENTDSYFWRVMKCNTLYLERHRFCILRTDYAVSCICTA